MILRKRIEEIFACMKGEAGEGGETREVDKRSETGEGAEREREGEDVERSER